MKQANFALTALYEALDKQRIERKMTWAAVAREVSRFRTTRRAIAVSTITSLQHKPIGEGDGILQMILWLDRTPESFVPGIADADSELYRLPLLSTSQILRWDTRALYVALNTERLRREWTWLDFAREIRGFTPGMLTNLSKGGRIGFPRVMRLVRWLDKPAVTFTRISDW